MTGLFKGVISGLKVLFCLRAAFLFGAYEIADLVWRDEFLKATASAEMTGLCLIGIAE